jgi:hypothetical protein
MSYFGSYFGPTTSGGGGGITLEQLQTELAAIKGPGWNGSTDTLADIRDNIGGAGLTSAFPLIILGPSQVSLGIIQGNSYTTANGTAINLTPSGFVRQGWPSSLAGYTVTLNAKATYKTLAEAGTGATTLTSTITVAGDAGAETLSIGSLGSVATDGLKPGDWSYQVVAVNGSLVRTLVTGPLKVIAKAT